MSRLTYYIARGETKDVASIECATCRKNAQYHGWALLNRAALLPSLARPLPGVAQVAERSR